MKSRTIVYSVIAHLLVASALLLAAERKQARRATAISMTEQKKKEKPKEEKPKPEPPKPPEVKPVAKRAAPAPAAEAKPSAPPPPSSAPAPVESGLTMGNDDGPGIALPGAPRVGPQKAEPKRADAPAPGPKKTAPGPKREERGEEECQEDASKPEAISKAKIEYTDEARAAGIEGRFILKLIIDKDGSVQKAEVVQGLDPQFDAAIIAAVTEKWRFKPALRCGKPVAGGVFMLARTFELGD